MNRYTAALFSIATSALTVSSALTISGCTMVTTAQLPENVKAEVSRLNPPLRGYSLDVTARSSGTIELAGHVSSDADKQRVVAAAKKVSGVTSVEDRLTIQAAQVSPNQEAESKYQSQIFQKLEDELVGAQYLVSVVDKSGDVVVQGSVDSAMTKGRVLEIVNSVVGPNARVLDEVKLASAPSDRWITEQVTTDLKKRFPSWSDKVAVKGVRNGVVTLTGSLGDHWDIDSVLAAVVMVPGVKDLNSEITINGKPYSSDGVRQGKN